MDHTQEKFHTPSKNPELTLKTDGDVYYAIPTADNTAKTYPAAEFPCYTINNTQALLSNLKQKTGTPDGNTQSTVEGVVFR